MPPLDTPSGDGSISAGSLSRQGGDPLRQKVPWTAWDMIAGSLAAALAIVVGAAIVAVTQIATGRGGISPAAVSAAALVSGGAMIWVVWRMGARKYGLSWDALGFRLPPAAAGRAWWLALGALAGSVGFTAVYAAIASALGFDTLVPQDPPRQMFGEGWLLVASAFAIVVWTPLAEEAFFRGFLFGGLESRYGLPAGVIASSAVFALAHVSIATMIPIFVTGALFAWAYSKTKSLWIPIFAHAGQNLLALLAVSLGR